MKVEDTEKIDTEPPQGIPYEASPVFAGLGVAVDDTVYKTTDAVRIAMELPTVSRILKIIDEAYPEQKENLRAFFSEIVTILTESRIPQSLGHAEKTADMVIRLDSENINKPALLIAALVHDLDRCKKEWRNKRKQYPNDRAHKEAHEQNGARIVRDLMSQHSIDTKLSGDVATIIGHHEFGVDEDGKTLMLADAIAFFQHNLPYYYEQELSGRRGKNQGRTREKIRLTIEKFNADEYATQKDILLREIKFLTYNRETFPEHKLRDEEWEELDRIFKEEVLGTKTT